MWSGTPRSHRKVGRVRDSGDVSRAGRIDGDRIGLFGLACLSRPRLLNRCCRPSDGGLAEIFDEGRPDCRRSWPGSRTTTGKFVESVPPCKIDIPRSIDGDATGVLVVAATEVGAEGNRTRRRIW